MSPSQNVPNWQLIAQFIVFDLVFGEAARKKTQLVKWHHFAGKNFSHFSLTLLMKVEWKNHKKKRIVIKLGDCKWRFVSLNHLASDAAALGKSDFFSLHGALAIS